MGDRRPRAARASLTSSGGFEKRGGYSPTGLPVTKLPKVPPGPAPGSSEKAPTLASDEPIQSGGAKK